MYPPPQESEAPPPTNGVPKENKPMEIPFLSPKRTIFLMGLPQDPNPALFPPAAIQKLTRFVEEGGQLISFNHGIRFLQAAFGSNCPIEITSKYTLQRLPSRVEFRDPDNDTKIFGGYEQNEFCVLEKGCVLIKPDPSRCEILATAREMKRKVDLPVVALRFKIGKGTVYHFVTPLFKKKVSENISNALWISFFFCYYFLVGYSF
jgi:hypothetical protein